MANCDGIVRDSTMVTMETTIALSNVIIANIL